MLLASCDTGSPGEKTSPPTPEEQPRGGAVTVGVLGDTATLDPYDELATDLTRALATPAYRSLFRVLPDGEVASDLVDLEALRPAPGGATVELSPTRWSNGEELTARDVVRSVRRATAPSGFAGLRARAVGKLRVRFWGDVFGDWARRLALGTFVVPAERGLEVASGPFVVRRHVPGFEVVYEPNPEWSGDPPLLDGLTVRFVSSAQMLLELLERGRLDAAVLPSSINLDDRLEEMNIAYDRTSGWETITLDLRNVSTPEMRAAVIAAIDRKHIAEGLIRDEGEQLGLDPPPGNGAVSEILLATAGGDELLQLMQRLMQKHLATKDIKAELIQIDPATFYGEWDTDGPQDVALRREVVARFSRPRVPDDLSRFPLFSVDTFVAFREELHGVVANGTVGGPLWNAHEWLLD